MDGQMNIFDFLDLPGEEKKERNWSSKSEDICKHSGHTCNKEELWKVAESFDDIMCQRKCCRLCNTKLCGARCNGSEEPQKRKSIIWHYSLTAIYTECPYCHAHNTENERTGECKNCHNIMDFDNPVEKKSKDVIECEKLGLKGPVYKDEKGKWCSREVKKE